MPQRRKSLDQRVTSGTFEARRPAHRDLLDRAELVVDPDLRRLQLLYRGTDRGPARIELAREFERACRRNPPPRQPGQLVVYLFCCPDWVKPGVSGNVDRRRRQLEAKYGVALDEAFTCPLEAVVAFAVETIVKRRLRDRALGEERFAVSALEATLLVRRLCVAASA